MGYTLANLETLTLAHLRRDASDSSAMTALMDGAINRWRREIWRRVAGGEPVPHTVDLVAGQSDYDVTADNVASVSVLDGAAPFSPRQLRSVTFADVLSLYPDYPGDGTVASEGYPRVYMVRTGLTATSTVTVGPGASGQITSATPPVVDGDASVAFDATAAPVLDAAASGVWVFQNGQKKPPANVSVAPDGATITYTPTAPETLFAADTWEVDYLAAGTVSVTAPGLRVSLYPIPQISVTGGLTAWVGPASTDLSGGAVSAMPPLFDETACKRAAAEVCGYLWDDDKAETIYQRLMQEYTADLVECRRLLEQSDSSPWEVHLNGSDSFGTHYRPYSGSFRQRSY